MYRNGIWLVSATCVLLGFFAVNGFGAAGGEIQIGGVTSAVHIERLLTQKEALESQKQSLIDSVREKEALIKDFEDISLGIGQTDEEIKQQIWDARVLAGFTDLQGSGIRIVLNDRPRESIVLSEQHDLSSFIVHDTDLLGVINELRSAGAEAIEINGVRILANSRISCGGPTINVGREQRFTPPFVINAIGDPQALAGIFQEPDSIYHMLVFYGLEFRIEIMDNVKIPRHYGTIELEYAVPTVGGG